MTENEKENFDFDNFKKLVNFVILSLENRDNFSLELDPVIYINKK